MLPCLLLVITLSLRFTYVSTALTLNVSIDDDSPDPLAGAQISYGLVNETGPAGFGWDEGQTCSTCNAQPDPSQAFNGTWHDTSTLVNGRNIPIASVAFTGVAVYVIGIIVTSCQATTLSLNNTRLFFSIDGTAQGSYVTNASIGPETVFSYNTTLFAKDGLAFGQHNITIECGDGNPAIDSVCLIDRIIYTTQVDSVSGATSRSGDKSHLSAGAIAGAVLGSISVLAVVAGTSYLLGRRNRKIKPATQHRSLATTTRRDVGYPTSQVEPRPRPPISAVHELERQEHSIRPDPTCR